jgi:radical SAM superfamily enzyme YgiQ (UPF0313 family)
MEILLTYPPKSLIKGWSSFLPFPMAPVCLGSFIESKGVKVKIYHDQPYDIRNILQIIKECKPEIFGMTCDSSNYNSCFRLSKLAKKIDKNLLVILGGIHATFFHKEIIERIPSVDVVVRGEGERTLLEIIKCLEAGQAKDRFSKIKGVSYKINGEIMVTPERPPINKLDSLPFLSYDLIDMKKIESYTFPGWWPLHTARGCYFNCRYCSDVGFWGRKYRFKSSARVIKEIELCNKEYGIQGFFFNDLTFTTSKQRTYEICNQLKNRQTKVKWGCFTRVDCVDKTLLTNMYESGCKIIVYGVESFSDKMLRLMGKGYKNSLALDILNFSNKLGIDTRFELLLGFPGETVDTLRETVSNLAMLNKGVTYNNINIFQIHPGSRIYNYANSLGLISADIWFSNFKMQDFIRIYYSNTFIKKIKKTAKEIERIFRKERKSKDKRLL